MQETILNFQYQYSKLFILRSNKRRLKLILIMIIVLITSCSKPQIEFNKEKWNERDDMFYANREKMVKDLMKNHLKKGMTSKEVLNLLGSPENYQDDLPNTLSYEIAVDYGWNIDPQEGKTLYIEFTNDSVIKDINLKEWKH